MTKSLQPTNWSKIDASGAITRISILEFLGDGLDGIVYEEKSSRTAVKIYKDKTPKKAKEREKKLRAMMEATPVGVSAQDGKNTVIQIAWPRHLVFDGSNRFLGFTMPIVETNAAVDLRFILTARDRAAAGIRSDFSHRIRVAYNLAALVHNLHLSEHHVVDLKPENAKVYRHTAFVVLLDCDGFSVRAKGGTRFATQTATEGYLAPETKGKPHLLDHFQDRFSLAILIFQILNEGLHPFRGIPIKGKTVPDSEQERIDARIYPCSKAGSKLLKPHPQSLHHWFEDETLDLFEKAFGERADRPTALDWCLQLKSMLPGGKIALGKCAIGSHHMVTQKGCAHCGVNLSTGLKVGQGHNKPAQSRNSPVVGANVNAPNIATAAKYTTASQLGNRPVNVQSPTPNPAPPISITGVTTSQFIFLTIAGIILLAWLTSSPPSAPTQNHKPPPVSRELPKSKPNTEQDPAEEGEQPLLPPKSQEQLPGSIDGNTADLPALPSEVICMKVGDASEGLVLTLNNGLRTTNDPPSTKLISTDIRKNSAPNELVRLQTYKGLFPLRQVRYDSGQKKSEIAFSYNISLMDYFPIKSDKITKFTMTQSGDARSPSQFRGTLKTGFIEEFIIAGCSYPVVRLTLSLAGKTKGGDKIEYREQSLFSNEFLTMLKTSWTQSKNGNQVESGGFNVVGIDPN